MILKKIFLAFFIMLFNAALSNTLKAAEATPLKVAVKSTKPKISIVIDDLGDNSIIAKKILSLTDSMTAAILPYTPHAKKIAHFAVEHGHEVIMHIPMEAFSRPDLLGPGALLNNMPKKTMQTQLLKSGDSIPHIVGFNNHMGSLLTENQEKMQWVMESAKQKGWYFLDSKTSESSIAKMIADKNGIPSISRDIFLDHHSAKSFSKLPRLLEKRFQRAKKIALRRGHVVIICHPYSETLSFLKKTLPELSKQFQLVKLSQLIKPSTVEYANSQIHETELTE